MQSVFKTLIADGGQQLCRQCNVMKGLGGRFLSGLICDKDRIGTACCTEGGSYLWAEAGRAQLALFLLHFLTLKVTDLIKIL